ncbi:hypothetical protein A3K78_10785 [Candidatus Bathyarchaeota archaeon RBG_13_52_12]|nr:MAG: hypothetical protein A3K78_10785 [Candidatus Bathyarchaeota archaeon RBG_13_52_12]
MFSKIKVKESQIPWIIVIILLIGNLWSLSIINWYRTQFDDNLELAQNHISGVKDTLMGIIEAKAVNYEQLRVLREWAEMTSTQAAMITYLDTNHFGLWERLSGSMALLEALTEDLMDNVGEGEVLVLDEFSLPRLSNALEKLDEAIMELFPDDFEVGNPWASPQYEHMDRAIGKIEAFESRIARCWLIIPHHTVANYTSPEDQAREYLVERLGENYVETYLTNYSIGFNTWEVENWLVEVTYDYTITVGDYIATRGVYFQFDTQGSLIRHDCVPPIDNLQPFTVTREAAVNTAKGEVDKSYVELDAEIYWVKQFNNGTRAHKYLWSIDFYHSEKLSSTGDATRVLIDPKSGKVVNVDKYSWIAIS